VRARDLDQALATMEPEFLACRYRRHAWDPYTAHRTPAGYDERLICVRCEAIRHTVYTRRFTIVRTSITYPAGYRLIGLGALTGTDRGGVRAAAMLPTVTEP